ncbi:MAG: HlyC/CorC family transporter [Rhodomicrobiaceae bacterium]
MEESIWLSLAIILVCFGFSAFFSGSETALTAVSRARMHALEQGGEKRAGLVTRMLMHRESLIGALLIGNNIANTAAAALVTGILLRFFGDAGILYATIAVSIIVILFSEILPKTIAINYPDRMSLIVARPVSWVVTVLGPLPIVIEAFIRWLLSRFGLRVGDVSNVLSAIDELRGQVALLHKEGGVGKSERDMLDGLLDLSDLTLEDIMVHRTRIKTVDAEQRPEEIVKQVLDSPHTRLPLWRGERENIIGILHAKDVLRALHEAGGDASRISIETIAREPWFVPYMTSVREQLRAFLAKKTHFAIAVDEFGEVQGLVTLEDIIEEIVGDIRDEHDAAAQGIRHQQNGTVQVDGALPIRDLNRAMNWNLPDEEATTIAGLVLEEVQFIPEVGQTFDIHGMHFKILRRLPTRITLIEIAPAGTVAASPTPDEAERSPSSASQS